MKTTPFFTTLLFLCLTITVSAQRPSGPYAEFSVGDIVPRGLVIAHCTSPSADGMNDGRLSVTMDKSIVGGSEWFLYDADRLLHEDDHFFGLDAGEYRLEVKVDAEVVIDELIQLTKGIQDYEIHFHELHGVEKSRTTLDNSFTIFPNPTDDMLQIQGLPEKALTIEVLDEQGRTVMSEQKAEESSAHRMSMNKLGNGVYTIHITSIDGEVIGTERVVVEH